MSSEHAEMFRRKAEACRWAAERAETPHERASWNEIAHHWMTVASALEEHSAHMGGLPE